MSDSWENDLIDLTIEKVENALATTTAAGGEPRNSLDSNPFDRCFKLSNPTEDPFEFTEMQALRQAQHNASCSTMHIKTADLLALDDEHVSSLIKSCSGQKTIDAESPPYGFTSDSDSAPATDSDGSGGCLTKSRKFLEERQRLLKLSICNSTLNSPVTRVPIQLFKKASNGEEQSLAEESPIKLVQENGLMSEQRQPHDYDADLEMMKIPILQQLNEREKLKVEQEQPIMLQEQATTAAGANADLAALRAKLQVKMKQPQEVNEILQNIKSLFSDQEQHKQQELHSLLHSLETALNAQNNNKSNNTAEAALPAHKSPPRIMVRQATFDMETAGNCEQPANMSSTTHSVHSNESAQEMPEAMICSSATYDGEAVANDLELQRPEIAPAFAAETSHFSAGINNVLQEIGKVLEQQQQQQQQSSDSNSSNESAGSAGCLNPTFIVVVNPAATTNSQLDLTKDTSKMKPTNSTNDSFISYNQVTSNRRRSSSVSLHDRIKVMQLPLSTANIAAKTAANQHDVDNLSPPVETNLSQRSFHSFATPARSLRRNTISTGTARTSAFAGNNTKRFDGNNSKSCLEKSILETSKEEQPVTTKNRLRLTQMPNMMKKMKPHTTNSSIMKSNGPMKATLPIKNVVAPTKPSPLTPDAGQKQTKLNTSMHFLNAARKISNTSTPMPVARNAAAGKRMTLGELKSPIKTNNAAVSANIARNSNKSSIKLSPKSITKTTSTATAGRLPVRLSNSRLSLSGNKAKENKHPN